MYVVPKRPIVILDSNLSSADSNYTQYVSGASYVLGIEVQSGQDIFRSLSASNTDTPVAETTSVKWKFLGKANKWAAFDEFNNSKTKHPTEIMYVVESRYVDYIGILGLKANNVKLELYNINDNISSTKPIWEYEENTFYRKSYNYSDYITGDGVFKSIFLKDIFPFYNTKLKIQITGVDIEVGNIIYNRKIDLGMVLANSSFALKTGNLIDIEIDSTTGNIKQVPILPIQDLTVPVVIETKDLERVQNVLEKHLGEACLFVALKGVKDKLPNVAIYGFYKDIRTPIGAEFCEYELLIQGVI